MTHNPFQKKLFGATTLILAGALAAGTAIAQAQPAHGRLARGIRAAMATLDLTDAQKDKVKAIFVSHKDEGKTFHEQAKADREALKAAASAAKPDPAAEAAAFRASRSAFA